MLSTADLPAAGRLHDLLGHSSPRGCPCCTFVATSTRRAGDTIKKCQYTGNDFYTPPSIREAIHNGLTNQSVPAAKSTEYALETQKLYQSQLTKKARLEVKSQNGIGDPPLLVLCNTKEFPIPSHDMGR